MKIGDLMNYKNFCQIVKNKRISLGLTQKDVRLRMGISQSKYSKLETGYQEPTFNELQILVRILNIDLNEILKLKEPIKPSKNSFD